MDQEKFDQHLMDYLFDELDEVTRAAMRQKIGTDAACRNLEAGLRATLTVGQLPLEEPSHDLEERILAAAERAQHSQPWHQKLLRSLSWAGSHAMRPQLAMAAVLLLVLGSSVLLLRARPGAMPVVPSRDLASLPAPAKTTPATTANKPTANPPQHTAGAHPPVSGNALSTTPSEQLAKTDSDDKPHDLDDQYRRGMANYRAGKHDEAQRDLAAVSQSNNQHAASAALYEARAVRSRSGCGAAVSHYASVRQRFSGSAVAADAMWEQADCHRLLGQKQEARALWLALESNPSYGSRAASELASGVPVGGSGKGTATGAKLAAPRRARAPVARPPSHTEKTQKNQKNQKNQSDEAY